jgi:hypothetical protein
MHGEAMNEADREMRSSRSAGQGNGAARKPTGATRGGNRGH